MESKKVCVICGDEFEGFGNNPEPVVSADKGLCCDGCNFYKVIPARIRDAQRRKQNAER